MDSEVLPGAAGDWPVTTLAEACAAAGGSIQTGPFGSQLHQSDYVSQGVPSIMPTNIGDNRIVADGIAMVSEDDVQRLRRHQVRPGDIVYSRRGDVGKRALIREAESGWLCGTGCLRVRPGEGLLDSAYLSFYLGHPDVQGWIERHAVGATMRNLNTGILGALPVSVPPLDEQRQVASILGALDDKIELNRRMSRTLDETAQAIFKSWFVDAVKHGLPEGWRMGRAGDLCELVYGDTLREQERKGGPVPVYGSNGVVGWHDEPLVGGPGIVVGRKGTAGAVTWTEGDFFPIDTTFYVRVADSVLLPYLYFALLRLRLAEHGTDTAVPGLNRNVAHGLSMVCPTLEAIRAFAAVTRPLQRRQQAASRQSVTLAVLRDALMPRLLSGELASLESGA